MAAQSIEDQNPGRSKVLLTTAMLEKLAGKAKKNLSDPKTQELAKKAAQKTLDKAKAMTKGQSGEGTDASVAVAKAKTVVAGMSNDDFKKAMKTAGKESVKWAKIAKLPPGVKEAKAAWELKKYAKKAIKAKKSIGKKKR